jgi:hypothetical protein
MSEDVFEMSRQKYPLNDMDSAVSPVVVKSALRGVWFGKNWKG